MAHQVNAFVGECGFFTLQKKLKITETVIQVQHYYVFKR